MQRFGTHAVYVEADGRLRVETVEQYRGNRPWTLATRYAARRARAERVGPCRNRPFR